MAITNAIHPKISPFEIFGFFVVIIGKGVVDVIGKGVVEVIGKGVVDVKGAVFWFLSHQQWYLL